MCLFVLSMKTLDCGCLHVYLNCVCLCGGDSYWSRATLCSIHCSIHCGDGRPDSHHQHNGKEKLAGLLMIHVFISYLPNCTPFSPRPPHPLSSLHPLLKRMCVWCWDSRLFCAPCQHATYNNKVTENTVSDKTCGESQALCPGCNSSASSQ